MAVRPIDGSELMIEIQACSWDSEQDKERAEDLVLGMPALTPPNKALTLEQLREMDGEPVWVSYPNRIGAIVNNQRLHGALYCWDIWGENGGPKEIPYLEAAVLLAETADKMGERPPEGEEDI